MSSKKKPRTFDDIIARTRPAERVVTLCLDSSLAAEYEALERRLEEALRATDATLASAGDSRELAQRMEDLRARMVEEQVEFRVRALPRKAWSDLLAAHPGRKGQDERFNPDTFADAAIAACSVDPVMSVAEVERLGDALGNGEYQTLFAAVWAVNTAGASIPFSGLALRTLRSTEPS